ncbi:TIGR02117 family protein [Methylopila sp. 73B]|uniref:TIGR02117 family protein n=1 Tax=Methylopila sp. 73B TaxID=1120792 RepID=UPI0003A906B2|nr:TIGR02117 family protein [Methylopila sp. 73B]
MDRARAARTTIAGLLGMVEALAVAGLLYLAAAAAGSVVLGPSATAMAGRRVTIFVVDNGYHVDLVLPTVDPSKDWRPLLDASPIATTGRDAPWVAFGWGSRTAYTEIGALSDLTAGAMLRALAFDRTVMHVLPVARVNAGEANVRTLQIAAPLYAAMTARIDGSFAHGAGGAVQPLAGVTQGYGDAYFAAVGAFSPVRTCNVWAGEMLRAGGVTVGAWTPFAAPLMKRL